MTTSTASTRVRFAPSPTGYLHVGGARTALFNWLFAKATGGKFLLRIEDTDVERSDPKFTQDILGSLKWMGMGWDEPPIHQSHRFERYRELANQLLAEGKAFRCGYSDQELEQLREQAQKAGKPWRYRYNPNKVSNSPTAPIRLRMPTTGETTFNDLIRGPITIPNSEMDDWILLRGNGTPTYNFSVVIDDHDQAVTHVIRGEDHINNTPKQIALYQLLGWQVPQFAHVPMILGADRQKLSKRHGAASTLEYRNLGFLPQSLVNFLVRLGWSHGDQEIFTLEELKKCFSLDHVGRSNAIFNTEKLDWVSQKWMASTPAKDLLDYTIEFFAGAGAEQSTAVAARPYLKTADRARLEQGVAIIQEKVKTIGELLDQMDCIFGEDPTYPVETKSVEERSKMADLLKRALPKLEAASFESSDLDARIKEAAAEAGVKFGPIGQALRFAVTGGKISPGLTDMMHVQGKATVLRRVQNAVAALTK
jgi:glutamyl-tRNA synthetase